MVNTSLQKLKRHLAGFDMVVKERTTATATTEGSWGFEHIKACFRDEIIPFVKALKDLFNTFNQYLIDELTECLKLDTELFKMDFIEKETYDKLLSSCTALEKHCISLKVDTQLNQEIFQRDDSVSKQSAPSFYQYFDLNELKAQSQKKDTRPTGRTFTLVGNACPLTRITATNKVPLREPIHLEVVAQESVVTKVYTRRPKVVQIVLWYLDSGCSKHMTGDRSQLTNFVHKFFGTVKFGNDQIAKIMGIRRFSVSLTTVDRR
nr:integrase, catalytic region, zinc finger, CCHC-type, peptidase aspartic, catalytic [Tanacetum cinerariifolium]